MASPAQILNPSRVAWMHRILCAAMLVLVAPGLCLAQPAPGQGAGAQAQAPQRKPEARQTGQVAAVPAASRAATTTNRPQDGQQARKKATATPASAGQAAARQSSARQAAARPGEATSRQQARASGRQAAQAPRSRIQCVQYVVANSAFRVRGNARDWWRNSAAIHARSNMPEPGSVLSFRSVKTMPLGHVALVTRVVSEREILVDHANWTRGAISRSHSVIDVSPRNDWTAVRLAVKPGAGASTYGSIYPTDGFIHARARDEVVNLAEKPAEVAPPPFAIPSILPWDAPTTRTSRDPG